MRLALQIWCYIPLLLGYWLVHSELSMWVAWIPDLFASLTLRLSGLLFGTFVCGALAGLIFTIPATLLYRQYAVAVTASVSVITALWDGLHGRIWGQMLFTNIALALDLFFLAVSLPLCTWMLLRMRPNNSFKPRPLRGSA
jgi:hypothetical protein